MASRAQITGILPETLPEDFVEWDEVFPSAPPVESGRSEPGPEVELVPKPAMQATEPHRAASPSTNLARGAALSILTLENTGGAAVPHPVQPLSRALLSKRDIVVLVVVLVVAISPVLFKRELETFDSYGFSLRRVPPAKPVGAPMPTMTTNQQPENAAPTRAPLALTAPPATAAATTAGEVQVGSEAAQRPIQNSAGPTQKQAKIMDDQLHTPTRLQMRATLAEQGPPPSGDFAAADINGSDNSNAIDAVFGSPKQLRVQFETQQVISVPAGTASSLLIQKTQPVYPLIARTGQVSGTIILAAIISKTGSVDNLRVVSGPVMLRSSALNAVRTWRFKPYMVQNEPTAFETTINVHFCGQAAPCVPDR